VEVDPEEDEVGATLSDPFLEELTKNADRTWCFDEGPRDAQRHITRSHSKAKKSQVTLEAFL
jgi:hypothetical protein